MANEGYEPWLPHLKAIGTSRRLDAALIERQFGQGIVSLAIGRRLKVIVVLMVNFGLEKRKSCRIVHIDESFAERVGVVALALLELKTSVLIAMLE